MNKIYNLVSFLEFYRGKQTEEDGMRPADHWIIRQMNNAIREVSSAMNDFEFDRAIRVAESFIWHDLADNYVEIIKHRINGFKTYETVYRVLLSSIIMISPIFPFVAEDSYQRLFREKEGKRSVFDLQFPDSISFDEIEAQVGGTTSEAISMMRDLKVKDKISLSDKIEMATILSASEIKVDEEDVRGTIRAEKLTYEKGKVEEKIISVKLAPSLYSVLREKSESFLVRVKENPSLLDESSILFEDKKIDTSEVLVTKTYSIQGRNVNCGKGFCVSVSR